MFCVGVCWWQRKRIFATAQKTVQMEVCRQKIRVLRTLQRAGIRELAGLAQLASDLRRDCPLPTFSALVDQLEAGLTSLATALDRLESGTIDYVRLEIGQVSLAQIIEQVENRLRTHGIYQGVIFRVATQRDHLVCDATHIVTLLSNAVRIVRADLSKEQTAVVTLRKTCLSYPFSTQPLKEAKRFDALGIWVASEQEPAVLEDHYEVRTDTGIFEECSNMSNREVRMWHSVNHNIVRAHHGYAAPSHLKRSTSICMYVIPCTVRQIRPPDMDGPYLSGQGELLSVYDQSRESKVQVEALLEKSQQQNFCSEIIKSALEVAKWCHGPSRRVSGEPFYTHSLSVACIVMEYSADQATVVSALLHDVIKEMPMVAENIEAVFGAEVMHIISGVTRLGKDAKAFERAAFVPFKHALALLNVGDVRVLHVKLADRLHNMRTIHSKSYERQKRTAEETLEGYVPMAARLGLFHLEQELKAQSIAVLEANPYVFFS